MQTKPNQSIDRLEGPDFDFDAGDLSLDYSNTAEFHASTHPEEYLNSYIDFLRWAYLGRIVPGDDANRLLNYALAHPKEAEQTLAKAIELREAMFHIFTARVHEQPVANDDLELFNRYLGQALAHSRVEFTEDPAQGVQRAHWAWQGDQDSLDQPLWPIVRAAAQLLTTENVERLGQCQDDRGCGWLFIDTSKNHSRRWCSMESCGNRAKAQRHYYGHKKTA